MCVITCWTEYVVCVSSHVGLSMLSVCVCVSSYVGLSMFSVCVCVITCWTEYV